MYLKLKKLTFIFIGFYTFLYLADFDDIIYNQLNRAKNYIKGVDKRLDLDRYKVEIEAKEIKGIAKNLSGITYNKDTNTLFAVSNSPRKIYELTKDGDILRTIKLRGFKDTEGIAYIGNEMFAVVDERKTQFFVLHIDKSATEISIDDSKNTFTLAVNNFENFGYEGIAYDDEKENFFLVNEKFPLELVKVSNLLKKRDLGIALGDGLTTFDHFMSDYSGLHFDSSTRHLLFLSHESKKLAEVSLEGVQVSFGDLEEGFMGLTDDIPQAEGVTTDSDGILYVVSEPNLFYRFKKEI